MIDLYLFVNRESESLIDTEKAKELKHFLLTHFKSSKFKYRRQMKEKIFLAHQ